MIEVPSVVTNRLNAAFNSFTDTPMKKCLALSVLATLSHSSCKRAVSSYEKYIGKIAERAVSEASSATKDNELKNEKNAFRRRTIGYTITALASAKLSFAVATRKLNSDFSQTKSLVIVLLGIAAIASFVRAYQSKERKVEIITEPEIRYRDAGFLDQKQSIGYTVLGLSCLALIYKNR